MTVLVQRYLPCSIILDDDHEDGTTLPLVELAYVSAVSTTVLLSSPDMTEAVWLPSNALWNPETRRAVNLYLRFRRVMPVSSLCMTQNTAVLPGMNSTLTRSPRAESGADWSSHSYHVTVVQAILCAL